MNRPGPTTGRVTAASAAADGAGWQTPCMHARSALFDVYGDHLRTRGSQAPVAAVVRLLAPVGIAGPAVRTAISRMVMQGWLEPVQLASGRGYRATELATDRLDRAADRIYRPTSPAGTAPGSWSSSRRRAERAARNRLRADLGFVGYAELVDHVWVSPFTRPELGLGAGAGRGRRPDRRGHRLRPAAHRGLGPRRAAGRLRPVAAGRGGAGRRAAGPAPATTRTGRRSRPASTSCTSGASSCSPTPGSRPSCCRRTGPATPRPPASPRRRAGSSRAPTGSWPAASTAARPGDPAHCRHDRCPARGTARGPAAPAAPVVQLDLSDGVATITLNRPEAMNSLDVATKELLLETVRAVADDPAARCVVLTGTGRAFCTGQDLKEHIRILAGSAGERLFNTVDEHYNPIVTTLAGMAKPVIAAVNGVAAGAGASLAFACDLRLVADTAGFNLAFANVALSCDTGASYHLQQLVGRAKAIELLYLPRTVSRPRVAGARAGHARRAGRRARGRGPRAGDRGWPPARRSRSGPSGARWPTPRGTPSRRRSPSRAR